jgi:hypothetical protein
MLAGRSGRGAVLTHGPRFGLPAGAVAIVRAHAGLHRRSVTVLAARAARGLARSLLQGR